jgi:hypothetical protein
MRLMKEGRREGQVTQFYCCHPLCRAEGMWTWEDKDKCHWPGGWD